MLAFVLPFGCCLSLTQTVGVTVCVNMVATDLVLWNMQEPAIALAGRRPQPTSKADDVPRAVDRVSFEARPVRVANNVSLPRAT